jgi:hypothetical protein
MGRRDVVEVMYDDPAYSFLVSSYSQDEAQSVLVDDLEIHTDARGRVLYVDGYAPRTRWMAFEALPPAARDGEVHTDIPGPFLQGSSVRLVSPTEWSIRFNSAAGWLCVGNPQPGPDASAVKVQPGIILVLEGRRLVAIWLEVRPVPADDA